MEVAKKYEPKSHNKQSNKMAYQDGIMENASKISNTLSFIKKPTCLHTIKGLVRKKKMEQVKPLILPTVSF